MPALRMKLGCWIALTWIAAGWNSTVGSAPTVFVEAESFVPASDGWQPATNPQTKRASRATALHGAGGDPRGTASHTVTLPQGGEYRIWVRYLQVAAWRGAFRCDVLAGDKLLGRRDFDLAADPDTPDWHYRWAAFDADLPAGDVVLRLSKFENQNCVGYTRHVDCLLLTTDKSALPDHLPFGPQTYVRVTIGPGYERPLYVHLFADHYRDPWYSHHWLARDGRGDGLAPRANQLLHSGDRTPWCNLTPLVYQDSGAILNLSARYAYHDKADRLRARFEFATAPQEDAVVRTVEADCCPNGLVIVMPPDLTTAENLARFGRDLDLAARFGKLADEFRWPQLGRRPERFPFFVSASLGGYELPLDERVTARERRTLDYFGFSNDRQTLLHGGIWLLDQGSYSRPDEAAMRSKAEQQAKEYRGSKNAARPIAFCLLMDEPAGQADTVLAADAASLERFRAWLKQLGKSPTDLGVTDWEQVTPVVATDREEKPELYYYTQRFRTRSLGDFLALQRRILCSAYGTEFPTGVNFSDGAVYWANFYGQGVDYFELLDGPDQNAIWSEDWANLASTYQCSAYNIELMRGAARQRRQTLGHYLIAHAGRKPWDVKLKAVGEVARGVKVLENFSYGTSWGSHEGGPAWQSHAWQAKPDTWYANAEIVREIGAVEDLLVPALPVPAQVALLVPSSADIWTLDRNHSYGFDRMHTWLALAHAQVPVDVLGERQVERGALADYKVCYLSGPNLTQAAAGAVRQWVEQGGTLWLTAAAAGRDEFNRPSSLLSDLLPVERSAAVDANPFLYGGSLIRNLPVLDEVRIGEFMAPVLSVKQATTPRAHAAVSARFRDGSPALTVGSFGAGRVYCAGFLPGLSYIYPALVARHKLEQEGSGEATGSDRLARSDNPWQFPPEVREWLLEPVRSAGVVLPLDCTEPLVDAVLMDGPAGGLLPLANYSLRPISKLEFRVRTARPVRRVESVHHGQLEFRPARDGGVEFSLPLESTDFVRLEY